MLAGWPETIESDFRDLFKDDDFVISGSTPEEKMASLACGESSVSTKGGSRGCITLSDKQRGNLLKVLRYKRRHSINFRRVCKQHHKTVNAQGDSCRLRHI